MLRCSETTPYTGRIPRLHGSNTALFNDCTARIPRLHGSNTALFNDRTARIFAPDITDRIVRPEHGRDINFITSALLNDTVKQIEETLAGYKCPNKNDNFGEGKEQKSRNA